MDSTACVPTSSLLPAGGRARRGTRAASDLTNCAPVSLAQLARKRLQFNSAGQLTRKLKALWCDGQFRQSDARFGSEAADKVRGIDGQLRVDKTHSPFGRPDHPLPPLA
jgi:hypothetical protein